MRHLDFRICIFALPALAAAVLLEACNAGTATNPAASAAGADPRGAMVRHAANRFFLYVADLGLNAVAILDSHYQLVRSITNGVNGPAGESFGKHGNLYVANCPRSRQGAYVRQYAPGASAPTFTYRKGLTCPTTVATDPPGYVYVYDEGYFINVYKRGQNSVVRRLRMPDKPPPYASYSWGGGLIADDKGNVFVTITANVTHRGQRGCYSRIFEYVRGKGRPHYLNDGLGCTSPGLALDSSANLIMTNTGGLGYVPCVGSIVVYPPPYTGSFTYFGKGSGPLCVPDKLALSPDQTLLFVSNYRYPPSGSPNVLVYSYPAGRLLTTLGTGNGLSQPYGLAISKRP